ncbi:MAG: hypothetical protein ACSLFH_07170 [Desulfuromonadales bacterium]
MQPLEKTLRNQFERTVKQARSAAQWKGDNSSGPQSATGDSLRCL